MNAFKLGNTGTHGKPSPWLGFSWIALALVLLIANLPSTAQDKSTGKSKSLGLILSGEATARDVGLPIYPGARAQKDDSDDSSALQMGLWSGSSGFKLVVLKFESDDSSQKVAAFYRKALGKYGPVLDCSGASSKTSDQSKAHSWNQLDCSSDQPDKDGFTLKAGTKQKQHIAGIQASGSHSRFQLVYVETPKPD